MSHQHHMACFRSPDLCAQSAPEVFKVQHGMSYAPQSTWMQCHDDFRPAWRDQQHYAKCDKQQSACESCSNSLGTCKLLSVQAFNLHLSLRPASMTYMAINHTDEPGDCPADVPRRSLHQDSAFVRMMRCQDHAHCALVR